MKWLLLDDSERPEIVSHTIQQLACAIVDEGDKVKVANTMFNGKKVPEKEIEEVLKFLNPDAVLFLGPCGLRFANVLEVYPGVNINLWFDDPLLRVGICGLHKVMARPFLYYEHFIWDGYWRDRASKIWQVSSRPIHLAASQREFFPSNITFNEKDIVFIGNLHSPREIELMMDKMPPTYLKLIRFIDDFLENIDDLTDCPSWDVLLKMAFENASDGDQKLITLQNERSDEVRGNAQWIIWAKCKNMVRIRMLRKALSFGTVRMFSETKQLFHATEDETRGLLNNWSSKLAFHATDGLNFASIAECYHHGWIHIQATDPQSVAGGIPYRVFQTAASGRALLTDIKPELRDAFIFDTQILGYDNAADFTGKLEAASKDKDRLREIGLNAHARFLAEHTWRHRVQYIKKCIFPPPRDPLPNHDGMETIETK